MSKIPNDPMILLSFINTKLRDNYPNLDLLCEDLDIEKDNIITKLNSIDYHYDVSLNRFL